MDSNESLFRICTRLLCDMTTSPEYAANAGALQALQAKAQALETHREQNALYLSPVILKNDNQHLISKDGSRSS
jgi:hypothetical protein